MTLPTTVHRFEKDEEAEALVEEQIALEIRLMLSESLTMTVHTPDGFLAGKSEKPVRFQRDHAARRVSNTEDIEFRTHLTTCLVSQFCILDDGEALFMGKFAHEVTFNKNETLMIGKGRLTFRLRR